MDVATERTYRNPFLKRFPATSGRDLGIRERKRIKPDPGSGHSASWQFQFNQKRPRVIDYSDPFSVNNLLDELEPGKYGSVTKEILELVERRRQLLDSFYAVDLDPELSPACLDLQDTVMRTKTTKRTNAPDVIDLDDDLDGDNVVATSFVPKVEQSNVTPVVIIDSDDENDDRGENFRSPYQELHLPSPIQELNSNKPAGTLSVKDYMEMNSKKFFPDHELSSKSKEPGTLLKKDFVEINSKKYSPYPVSNMKKSSKHLLLKDVEQNSAQSQSPRGADPHIAEETQRPKDKGEYVGTDDEEENDELSDTNSDGLGDIWNEMTVAMECSKAVSSKFIYHDAAKDTLLDEHEAEEEEECEHSFILKDDIGDVCRICGVIKRGIETIIEYNFSKTTRSTRTYRYEGRANRDIDLTETLPDDIKLSEIDFTAAEIYPHPRHRKEMKPHQIEGFNFLLSNLVTENPGGCIMAHAPGSGKTFMIISFLQSFMAKYPAARPLVVLPRGILGIWKKEFVRWQVEDIPLYDFYSVKADSRAQQLEVLKEWVNKRSILFLGYKQFSSIVCDTDDGNIAVSCQTYLLKIPSILILDEGHTPRNQDTDILTSLERVETTRKVVLSGTLYQNHVKEVFNILNLVRPKFLKMETSKVIRRRILSRADINSRRNLMKNGRDNEFYELIEHSLIKDENHTRKVTVIQDLREMTRKVLHYYKGDNLDELPGLVDFSIFLHLSPAQKHEVKELTRTLSRKFTITARGSAIYVHPDLKSLAKNTGEKDRVDEEKIGVVAEKIKNVREGVKLNFYLNLLNFCESSGEKVLVFSQYLLPLNFLLTFTAMMKGYSMGKEMFIITGDSDNEARETALKTFNESSEARVFFGSIRACGEGISLVGASRIIILDVHLNPSVTRQAIGRAFRPGQIRKVYVYRLIASGSPEEEDHDTCFKKESISKMWFEWDECRGTTKFDMETVDVNSCGDIFLESAGFKEDVIAIKKR